MNAAGQVLIEYLFLLAIFILVVAAISRKIPVTFNTASPYLAGKVEQRVQTGSGFSTGAWIAPVAPKGGVRD